MPNETATWTATAIWSLAEPTPHPDGWQTFKEFADDNLGPSADLMNIKYTPDGIYFLNGIQVEVKGNMIRRLTEVLKP